MWLRGDSLSPRERLPAGKAGQARTCERRSFTPPGRQVRQTWRRGAAWNDTHKDPLVWHVKHVGFHFKDEQGLPAEGCHLLACTRAFTGEVKYFLGYAPGQTLVKDLLRVALDRWPIERCFLEGNGEVGPHPWEGRRWLGLKRYLILTAVSYLFLANTCQPPETGWPGSLVSR